MPTPSATSSQALSAVTKHLQMLADAGLVKDLKMGRERL
jgi:DNA-binding transcriptional ArsR family regulator